MRTAAEEFALALAHNNFGKPSLWTVPKTPTSFDQMTNSAKGICTIIRREKYVDKEREIHFDLVDDMRLNALAFATKKVDYVGILSGTEFIIVDLFNRMLAHPQILSSIGNSDLETTEGIMIPALYNNYAQSTQPQRFPKCPTRMHYAHILAEVSLKFIAGHEMGHLLNGHCELRSQNCSSILCLEREDIAISKLDNLSLQTLELDADSTGAFWCWQTELFMHSILPDLLAEFPQNAMSFEAAYKTPESTCATLLFALWTVFRLFDERHYNEDNLLDGTHPASVIRAIWTTNSLREHPDLERSCGISPERFTTISRETFRAVEDALVLITNVEKSSIDYIKLGVSNNALMLVKSVHECWSELRPRLELLKRGGKLSD